jgi:hypothetical protein
LLVVLVAVVGGLDRLALVVQDCLDKGTLVETVLLLMLLVVAVERVQLGQTLQLLAALVGLVHQILCKLDRLRYTLAVEEAGLKQVVLEVLVVPVVAGLVLGIATQQQQVEQQTRVVVAVAVVTTLSLVDRVVLAVPAS